MTRITADERSAELVELLEQSGPVFIEDNGAEVAVLVSVKDYEILRRSQSDAAIKALREFGEEAQANGMTQQIADEILAERDAERKAARAA